MLDLDVGDLNLDTIMTWPAMARAGLCALILFLIVALAFWFDTRSQMTSLEAKQKQEVVLRKEFEEKQQKAANLKAYQEQLTEMRQRFKVMLRQLPSKTEIPGLLEDISKTGLSSGLRFTLFDPLQPVQHEFYSELPINISVIGDYHQLGKFINRIAAFNRIVTMHDFTLEPQVTKQDGGNDNKKSLSKAGELSMQMTAKIYRYTGETSS